jgi:hypothetical protein
MTEQPPGTAGSQPAGPEQPITVDVNINFPGYTSPSASSTGGGLTPEARPEQCLCACGSNSGHGAGG